MNALTWSWEGASLFAAAWLALILAWTLVASHYRLWARSRLRWLLVSVLNLLAALALAALFNPPEWRRMASQDGLLLTFGAEPAISSNEIYVTPEIEAPPKTAALLLHAGQLPLRQPALGTLEIRGHGLHPAEARTLPGGIDVTFQPPELEGIVRPDWTRTVTSGTPLRLTATFTSPDGRPVDVELSGPDGEALAQQRIQPGSPFRFTFRPLAPGLAEYRMTVQREEAVVASEPIPIHVVDGQAVDILVLQSAPSFEIRELRRWAGDRGSRIRVQTQVSENHWISQGVNVLQQELDADLDPALLETIDMLIVDGRAWTGLSANRLSWISTAVEQGLGLMILADRALLDAPEADSGQLLSAFDFDAAPDDLLEIIPTLPGLDSDLTLRLAAIKIGGATVHPMLTGAEGEWIEAWKNHGAGRVAVSRLSGRHRWATTGDRSAFSAYWSQALGLLARPRKPPFLLPPDATQLARPGERTSVCALAQAAPLKVVLTDPTGAETVLPMSAPGLGGPKHCAFFWPISAGWHLARLEEAATGRVLDRTWRHVTGPEAWQTERHRLRQEATRARFDEGGSPGTPARATGGRETSQPVVPVWPWLLFLLASASLWVERRVDS